VAGMDVVKSVGFVQPGTLCVVDHEFYVWREPVGLNWREIDS
jgi:hypothetical protein